MLDSLYSLSSRFWQIAIGCAKRKMIERRAVRHWRAALFLFGDNRSSRRLSAYSFTSFALAFTIASPLVGW